MSRFFLRCLLAGLLLHLMGSAEAQTPALANRCADAEEVIFKALIQYPSRTLPDIQQLNRWYAVCPTPKTELRAAFHLLRCAYFVYNPRTPLDQALEDANEALHSSTLAKNASPAVPMPGYEAAFSRLYREMEIELNRMAREAPFFQSSNRSLPFQAEEEWSKPAPASPHRAAGYPVSYTRSDFEKNGPDQQPAAMAPIPMQNTRGATEEPYGYVGMLDSILPKVFFRWINRPAEPVAPVDTRTRSLSSNEPPIIAAESFLFGASPRRGISLLDTLPVLSAPDRVDEPFSSLAWGEELLLLGERRFIPNARMFFEKVRLVTGETGWISSGSAALVDQIAVLIRELPAFDVDEDGRTQVLRMLPVGSVVAVSDRNNEWARIDAPYMGVSGWIADFSALSYAAIDREIAFRLARIHSGKNSFTRQSELLDITRLAGFDESPLASEVSALLYRSVRP